MVLRTDFAMAAFCQPSGYAARAVGIAGKWKRRLAAFEPIHKDVSIAGQMLLVIAERFVFHEVLPSWNCSLWLG